MSTQKTLTELQKETFHALKDQVLDQRKHEARSITSYRKVYIEESSTYESISSKAELFDDIKDAQIIFCGDFHTLKRSQYSALKILRFLAEQGRKIFIGLELVPVDDEDLANDFVENELTEKEFLEKINYERIWGFPWENYSPLFDFAREKKMPILGLNLSGAQFQSLADRDKAAAERVVTCLQKYPKAVVFCLYGDLHVASKHIPGKVKNLMQRKKMNDVKTVSVFQNSSEIYWRLLEQNLAHNVDVVKLSTRVYCIMSSTPWIKWQSYQSWIEEHGNLLEQKDEETFGFYAPPDFFHEIHNYAKSILTFLQETVEGIDDFEILTALDTKVTVRIQQYLSTLEDAPKKSIQKILESELVENGSILIPDQSMIYLLDFSQNRAAEKSAQLIATKLTQSVCIYGKDYDERETFYRIVLWEAIGYFGSKIMNPKRKCNQYKDFERKLVRMRGKKVTGVMNTEKIVATIVLQHRKFELDRLGRSKRAHSPRKIFRLKPKQFFIAARSLGRILGDQLYAKIAADLVPLSVVQHLFKSLSAADPAQKVYWEMAEQIKSHQPMTTVSNDELF